MPDQQVQQIDFEELVDPVAHRLRAGHLVPDPALQARDRPAIVRQIVAVQGHLPCPCGDVLQQFVDVLAHGLGVGLAADLLQLCAAALLLPGHPAAAPDLAVGEVGKEGGLSVDRDVEVERVVLALLEGDEPVDGDIMQLGSLLHDTAVKQQAVASQAVDLAIDGRR